MNPRLLAQLIAAGRVVVGAVLFLSPARVTKPWVGAKEGSRTGTRVMAMGLGARDVVLGAGTLMALGQGAEAARPWLAGGVAADAMDLTATLRAAGDIPAAAVAGVALVAGGAAAAGAYVLSQDV